MDENMKRFIRVSKTLLGTTHRYVKFSFCKKTNEFSNDFGINAVASGHVEKQFGRFACC